MAGLDVARIAARAGLAMSDVSDPDVSIPLARLEAVWTAITEEPGGMDVGLTCLDSVRLSVGGALGYRMRNAETVGHAFGLLGSSRPTCA
ncbi:MAG TPA: AraC family transcriptional regulator ligand-binding domain-containing protein [Polyangia bacterium]